MRSGKLPSDKEFRGAWTENKGQIVEDLTKSKEIAKNKLREARKPKMNALDVDYMLADEKGNSSEKLSVSTKKQVLRDITEDSRITEAKNIDSLREAISTIKAEVSNI